MFDKKSSKTTNTSNAMQKMGNVHADQNVYAPVIINSPSAPQDHNYFLPDALGLQNIPAAPQSNISAPAIGNDKMVYAVMIIAVLLFIYKSRQ